MARSNNIFDRIAAKAGINIESPLVHVGLGFAVGESGPIRNLACQTLHHCARRASILRRPISGRIALPNSNYQRGSGMRSKKLTFDL